MSASDFNMPSKTNNLRDKLEDNELDLSLMQLTEVPVQEIVSTNFVTMTTFVCQNSNDPFVNCELRAYLSKTHTLS